MQRILSLRHLSKKCATDVSHSFFSSPSSYQTSTSIIKQAHTFRSYIRASAPHSFSFMLPRKCSYPNFKLSNVRFNDWSFWLLLAHFGKRFSRLNGRFPDLGSCRSWKPPLWWTSDNVVFGLIAVNIAVLTLWKIGDRRFMIKHFMISLVHFQDGLLHTMVTSAFSHIDSGHLFSNMIGLFVFGTNIGRSFGPEFLLILYLTGAVGSSVMYLIHHGLMSSDPKVPLSQDPRMAPGLGASGAVNAIMLLDIFLNPRHTIYFELLIPVPAMLLGIFLIGKDVLRIMQGDRHVSGSGHLGGAMVAALAWLRIKRGRF